MLLDPFFRDAVSRCQMSWRKVVATAATLGVPTPAFSTALAFYDGYRSKQLPANLLQVFNLEDNLDVSILDTWPVETIILKTLFIWTSYIQINYNIIFCIKFDFTWCIKVSFSPYSNSKRYFTIALEIKTVLIKSFHRKTELFKWQSW